MFLLKTSENSHTREICVNRNETHLFLPVEYCELKFFSIHPLNLCEDIRKCIFFYFFLRFEHPASHSQFMEIGKTSLFTFTCCSVYFKRMSFLVGMKMKMFFCSVSGDYCEWEKNYKKLMVVNHASEWKPRYTVKICMSDRKNNTVYREFHP